MTTQTTLRGYFDALQQNDGWQDYLADDMVFTRFTIPLKTVNGRENYVQSTRGFYSMIVSVEVKELIVSGDKACVLTHYELQPPIGDAFTSDVAEIFTVRDGKIDSFSIYFDNTPFPN